MSISRSQRRLLKVAGVASVLVGLVWILLPALGRSSNCGGNSAALAKCRSVAVCLFVVSMDRGYKSVSITELSATERENFDQLGSSIWIGDAKILVTRATVRFDSKIFDAQATFLVDKPNGRVIVSVCDTPFDNVPRRMFGRAPFAHAVAYADGSSGLISVEDFRRLDLSGFVDVRTLWENRVEPNSAATGNQPVRSEIN
jgi:hypothetical protein